jgi:hypothetical protein
MSTLAEKIQFCEAHIRDKEGRPFSLETRRWAIDEFLRPATGFKWWPADEEGGELCPDCKALAGTVEDWTEENPTQTEEHRATGCTGLTLEPIILHVLKLPRQSGKTFTTAGLNLSTLFLDYGESIMYVAAAGDQTTQLFEENYVIPIQQNKKLRSRCEIVGNTIYVPRTKSLLECVTTSHRSITGRGRSRLAFDESRDIEARVFMAAMPAIFARNGCQCPHGHERRDGKPQGQTCSVCRSKMIPWVARIIAMSSAGMVEGSSRDWFEETVKVLEEKQDKNAYLYVGTERGLNPAVSEGTKAMVERIFSKVASAADFVDLEVHNISRRKGQDYLAKSQWEAVLDKRLHNQEHSERRAVSFLDVSETVELTSWVVLAEASEPGEDTWSRLEGERIDVWNPAKIEGGVIDETTVLPHFERYMPLFPELELWVDTRLSPWAKRFVKLARLKGWGRRVHPFEGKTEVRNAGYRILGEMVIDGRVRLIDHPILRKEFPAARAKFNINNEMEVREEKRNVRHLDVLDGHAACAYLAHQKRMRGQAVGAAAVRQRDQGIRGRLLNRLYRPGGGEGFGPDSY